MEDHYIMEDDDPQTTDGLKKPKKVSTKTAKPDQKEKEKETFSSKE